MKLKHPNTLYEWLRDHALSAEENKQPSRLTIAEHFGPNSPSYQRDIAALKALYGQYASSSTIKVKRQLWQNLLTAALGEIASSPTQMDDLFVRHTYLTAVIGVVVQASFGSDIYRLAETDPADLLQGRDFRSKTGLQGIVESDFFAWPAEVGGLPLLRTLARRVARFDWQKAPNDVAAILYETVIPPEERRQLGEYYTPDWLARTIVRELVTDPLDQYVLDPACGSGTFVAETVTHFIEAANNTSLDPKEVLEWLRFSVAGIDVHPVAVHLARAAWVLAAQPAIQAAVEDGFAANVTVPIYLGDALQLRFRTGDMFAQHQVTIQVEDEQNTSLAFPVSLVERAETFDALMGDIAEAIENGDDPHFALDDHRITDDGERKTLENTIAAMQRLHSEGRNHIWAYYTRNLVRPVALARRKVDVIVGNPPWLIYRNTASTLRDELERQSRNLYGIWTGGKYAAVQDIAGLFYARCTDLYLKDGGHIGMVMPHSALQTGQYMKWRTGSWQAGRSGRILSVNFGCKTAWDLERLEPNTFFPVPASVVFAQRIGLDAKASRLAGEVERWLGKAGASDVKRVPAPITDTSANSVSPYDGHSRKGADIYPRCFYFVEEIINPSVVRAGQTITVNPRRGSQDKKPWRSLDLAAITEQTIEVQHVFDVHLGETLVPYATLAPLRAVLPFKRSDAGLPADIEGVGGVDLGALGQRMRDRWQAVSRLWEENKRPVNKLNLLGRLDYLRSTTLDGIEFESITPDAKSYWLNQSDSDFDELPPLANRDTKLAKSVADEQAVFRLYSMGVVTNRDEWVYDFDRDHVGSKVRALVNAYEESRAEHGGKNVEDGVLGTTIKWTRDLKRQLRLDTPNVFERTDVRPTLFRPFVGKYLYFNQNLNEIQYQLPEIFPNDDYDDNKVICFCVNGKGFYLLAADRVIDLHFTGDTQCLPLYRYTTDGERVSNITGRGAGTVPRALQRQWP